MEKFECKYFVKVLRLLWIFAWSKVAYLHTIPTCLSLNRINAGWIIFNTLRLRRKQVSWTHIEGFFTLYFTFLLFWPWTGYQGSLHCHSFNSPYRNCEATYRVYNTNEHGLYFVAYTVSADELKFWRNESRTLFHSWTFVTPDFHFSIADVVF